MRRKKKLFMQTSVALLCSLSKLRRQSDIGLAYRTSLRVPTTVCFGRGFSTAQLSSGEVQLFNITHLTGFPWLDKLAAAC